MYMNSSKLRFAVNIALTAIFIFIPAGEGLRVRLLVCGVIFLSWEAERLGTQFVFLADEFLATFVPDGDCLIFALHM